jgi:hypothetical protein
MDTYTAAGRRALRLGASRLGLLGVTPRKRGNLSRSVGI